ncbi:hypothetical protein ABPG74_010124 [Tetrahymena malaccensis]
MSQDKLTKLFYDGKYIKLKNEMDKSQLDLYLANQKHYDVLTINSYLNSENSESLAQNIKLYEKLIAFRVIFNGYDLDCYAFIEELCRNLQFLRNLKFLQLDIDLEKEIVQSSEFLTQLGKSLANLKDLENLSLFSFIPEIISEQELQQFKIQLEQLKKLESIKFDFVFVQQDNQHFFKEFASFFTNVQQLQNLNLQLEFQIKMINEIDSIIPRIYSLNNLKRIEIGIKDQSNLSTRDIQQLQKDLMNLNSLNNLKLTFQFLKSNLTQELNELLNASLSIETLEKLYFQIDFQQNQDFQFVIGNSLKNPIKLSTFKLKLKNHNQYNEQIIDFQVILDENIQNLINLKKMYMEVNFIQMHESSYRNLGNLLKILKNLENLKIQSNCDMNENLFIEFGQTFSNLSSLKRLQLGMLLNSFEQEKYGFMDGISPLVQLEQLEIESLYYVLGENLPNAFQNLVNLKTFTLNSYLKVANKDLESFGDSLYFLKSLNRLKIQLPLSNDTQNISKICSSIGNLANLKSLNISFYDFLYNHFSLDFNYIVQLFSNISNLTNLIELNLELQAKEQFKLQFDNTLINTIMNLPKLRKLEASVQQLGLNKIIRKHKRLVLLYLN